MASCLGFFLLDFSKLSQNSVNLVARYASSTDTLLAFSLTALKEIRLPSGGCNTTPIALPSNDCSWGKGGV